MKSQPTAFGVVDILLYFYAILSMAVDLVGLETGSSPGEGTRGELGGNIIRFAFIAFIAIVFIRNYLVMRAIDNRHKDDQLNLKFLDLHGPTRLLERYLRFLIILIIVASSKEMFVIFSNVFSHIRDFSFSIFYIYQVDKGGWLDVFSYYSTMLMVLFIVFIIYDLVGVYSVSVSTKSKSFSHITPLTQDNVIASCGFLQSFLAYLNYYDINKPNNGKLTDKTVRRISCSKWLGLYFISAKFRERLFGFTSALLGMLVVFFEFDSLSSIFAAFSLFFYTYYLCKNEDAFKGLFVSFPKSLFGYFFQLNNMYRG